MHAKKGDWFSLTWEINNFYERESFRQWECRPRFLYAEKDINNIESEYIDKLYRLQLISIHRTSVFISTKTGVKLPTHYRAGEFMPGDQPKYDKWLAEYHKVNFDILEKIKDKSTSSTSSEPSSFTKDVNA